MPQLLCPSRRDYCEIFMGNLATFLQRSFSDNCPSGWICRREVWLLPPDLEQFLGYSSRADVVLEREDGARRLWIEFEISRADPVANHAKFATAHLFQPQLENDCFVAMMSAHVERGRRNLAANTILLMRHVGMSAFQTYFVFDPRSGTFAPSKFCAFTGIAEVKTGTTIIAKTGMTMELYAVLDESEAIFDGQRAQVHLTRNLAMTPHPAAELPKVAALFQKWLEQHSDSIKIHPRGAVFLLPPSWFG